MPDPALDQSGGGEPLPGDPLSQLQTEIDPDRLAMLGYSLGKRRDEWVDARAASGVEKRWQEDTDQYMARDEATKQASSMMDAVERGYPVTNQGAKPTRSTLYVNITRPKTNAAEARIASMLYPADDRNWGIKPTPIPVVSKGLQAAGQPQSPVVSQPGQSAQIGQQPQSMPPQGQTNVVPIATGLDLGDFTQVPHADQAPAIDAAKAMTDEIDDALNECGYNGEGRAMLHDCALLGTGVIKGPIVVNRVRKAWTPQQDGDQSVHVLEFVREIKPFSERVNPWNIFPDPACEDDPQTGAGMMERKLYSPKQLRELAKQPGYIKVAISQALEEGPQSKVATTARDRQRENDGRSGREQFELWEYWGEFTPEDLLAAGVEGVGEGSTELVSGCVIFVNAIVIKAFLNPIETGDIPYDFLQWEPVDGSPWGYGVPRLIRPAQKALTAAWRQMMDNAGLSIGPQVVIGAGIVPADKKWEITGRKVWQCTDESVDIRDRFGIFQIENHQQELTAIIELAMKFADEESSIPQLAQGEQGQAPDTVGGMTILMNSANVVLQRMVKRFDDQITRPHITRYYDWMMAYSKNPAVKGDFQVDARGSSALLVKDQQAQALVQLGAFQGSANIGPLVNWENWFKQILKSHRIDPRDILKTDDEIAALKQQAPPPSPEQLKVQGAVQVAQIKAGADVQAEQVRVQAEQRYTDAEMQISQQSHAAKMQELELQRELEIMKYANMNQLNLSTVKADLAKTAMIEGTKRQLAGLSQQADGNPIPA